MAERINSGTLFGRGVAFPPKITNGRLAWSEGEVSVRESIQIILLTENNERLRRPEFGGGLKRFIGEPNAAVTHHQIEERIQKSLERWEPRIALETVQVEADPQHTNAAMATIEYRLVATGARERVGVRVPLQVD
jgi:uncharacterized protein